ncbi:MAG TPA: hypothetical protein VGR55_19235 [Candidatus Acidoferrum sp.]|nr:hypothetical protein [Candidatus Acidoferrum sp.]
MKRPAVVIFVILCISLLGFLLYGVFGKAIKYEIPGGFKGWLIVRWDDQRCPPLRRQGMFLLLSFPASEVACTSSPRFADLTYLKFEYVFPDGRRQPLRWNDHGKPGTQVWLLGYSNEDKTDEIFVGGEHENWGRYPKPTMERR